MSVDDRFTPPPFRLHHRARCRVRRESVCRYVREGRCVYCGDSPTMTLPPVIDTEDVHRQRITLDV